MPNRRGRAALGAGTRPAPSRVVPSPSGSSAHSSQASPGRRISARSRSSRPGSRASTRQKSTTSPMRSSDACRRPRRMPTPPTARSSQPFSVQSRPPTSRPPALAAEGGEFGEDRLGRRSGSDLLLVHEDRGARPVGVTRDRGRPGSSLTAGRRSSASARRARRRAGAPLGSPPRTRSARAARRRRSSGRARRPR